MARGRRDPLLGADGRNPYADFSKPVPKPVCGHCKKTLANRKAAVAHLLEAHGIVYRIRPLEA